MRSCSLLYTDIYLDNAFISDHKNFFRSFGIAEESWYFYVHVMVIFLIDNIRFLTLVVYWIMELMSSLGRK